MDPPHAKEQVVRLAEAQAWNEVNTVLTSLPENPSTSTTSQDGVLALPTQDDQKAPSLSTSSHVAVAATPLVVLSPVVTASRKRKQASPQPCRDSTDMAGGPSPAKLQAKDKISSEAKHGPGKMLPVHCSIETADAPLGKEKDNTLEGYAIVPSTLLLKELVRVAMTKLDCPKEQFRNAVGVIQVQNWKALPFNLITDDPQATVGQILGDLLSYITLKIKITSRRTTHLRTSTAPSPSPSQSQLGIQPTILGFPVKKSAGSETIGFKGIHEIRLKLLQLLEKRGPTMLVSHGCPFSQGTVLAILQCKYNKPIQQEKLQSFYQWYNIYNGLMDNTLVSAEKLDTSLPVKPSSRHWRRPRTLFDQRSELPRLMTWYRMNPRPTRAELEIYLAELNSSERRRNSHPLQYSSIAIWFKNARAKYRGMRGLGPDFLDPERVISRIGKAQTNRITETVEPRKEISNGPRQTYVQLSNSKPKAENRARLTLQERKPQKSVDIPVNVEATCRIFNSIRPNLSNGHIGINHTSPLISNTDPSSIFPKVVNSSSISMESPISTPNMPPASTSTTATSQVTDIRKIASGFGIMLSPSIQDPGSQEQKLLPVQNIKVEEPPATSICTTTHDATVLNLSNSKPALTSANSTTSVHPTPATSHAAPSGTLATAIPPLRIPTTTMVHSTMSNGSTSTPHHPKPRLSSDSQRGPTISHQNTTSKSIAHRQTRKRFNIHPSLEVPKLQAWFCINPKPDRHTIEQFVAELNRTEFRKNQPKYDSRIVYVWFKNARAKYSRQKIRGDEGGADTSNLTLTYSRVITL